MEALYARVLPLLDNERSALVELNYERLYAELAEKDEVLSALRRLDRERLRFQDNFAMISGKPAAEISLRFIGEYLISEGGQEAELGTTLLARRERIEALVERIQQAVARNGRFIEKSVKNIRMMAQDIAQAIGSTNEAPEDRNAAQHQTYGAKGKVKKAPQKSGTLVSKHL
jgi:flagellar biosynthesis/type III secretory pathway chaperone